MFCFSERTPTIKPSIFESFNDLQFTTQEEPLNKPETVTNVDEPLILDNVQNFNLFQNLRQDKEASDVNIMEDYDNDQEEIILFDNNYDDEDPMEVNEEKTPGFNFDGVSQILDLKESVRSSKTSKDENKTNDKEAEKILNSKKNSSTHNDNDNIIIAKVEEIEPLLDETDKPIKSNLSKQEKDDKIEMIQNEKIVVNITKSMENQESENSLKETFVKENPKPNIKNDTALQVIDNTVERKEVNDDISEKQKTTKLVSSKSSNADDKENEKIKKREFSLKSNTTDIVYIIYLNENA